MANICEFDMRIELTEDFDSEQLVEFVEFLSKNGAWIPVDMNAVIKDIEDEALDIIYLYGQCRWSVASSFGELLKEYVQAAQINMELFSAEPGFKFAEHYRYDPTSGIWIDECTDYSLDIEDEDYIYCIWWNVDDWNWELI